MVGCVNLNVPVVEPVQPTQSNESQFKPDQPQVDIERGVEAITQPLSTAAPFIVPPAAPPQPTSETISPNEFRGVFGWGPTPFPEWPNGCHPPLVCAGSDQ